VSAQHPAKPGAAAPEPATPVGSRIDWGVAMSRAMPLVVLAVLVAAVAMAEPAFLGTQSIKTVVDESSPIMILAAGETLVILMGGIDLSIAALASLSTVMFALWLPEIGWLAIPAVLGCTMLAGAIQGFIHAKAQIPSFVVTLGGLALWSGIALTASNASNISVTDGYDAIAWAFTTFFGFPSAFLIVCVAFAILGSANRWLPIGRWISSIGNSEPAARLSGVRVESVKVLVFAVSGLCAGICGLLLVARTYSGAPTLADNLLLPTVAAVVVGGTAITGGFGGLGRTFVGVLIITVLRVGLGIMGVDPSYEQIAYGLVVIIAVALTLDRSKLLVVK
jgi:ribose transport system permease protein